jgi:hypothetical protein
VAKFFNLSRARLPQQLLRLEEKKTPRNATSQDSQSCMKPNLGWAFSKNIRDCNGSTKDFSDALQLFESLYRMRCFQFVEGCNSCSIIEKSCFALFSLAGPSEFDKFCNQVEK